MKRKNGSNRKEYINMDDRRVFVRVPIKFGLRFLNLWEGKEGGAVTQDISAKGIGFVANENFPIHTALEMWLNIPDKSEPVYSRGEVVWANKVSSSKYKVGVSLDKADLMGVSRLLKAA